MLERWVLGVCGSVMREGWAEIFKWVMSVRSRLVFGDSQIDDVEQEGEEALRKKRERDREKKSLVGT